MSQRAAVSSAALGFVALAASLALLTLPACNECDSSIDPVKCTDLCTQDPPHEDCAQCSGDTKSELCPQCRDGRREPGCPPLGGEGGAGTLSGGAGGVGGTTGGSGGTAGVVSGNGGMGGGTGGAGTGGDGGDAGPVPTDCKTDDACIDHRAPHCDDSGMCAGCEDNAVCIANHDERSICDTAGLATGVEGICVECRTNADCNPESPTPICVDGECEECGVDTDCNSDSAEPECGPDKICVACSSAAACSMRGDNDLCDMRPAEMTTTEGECVECLTHANCPNDRPQCGADGQCGPCDEAHEAAVCSGRMDGDTALGQCNSRMGLETYGQCVHCTADNEASVDGCGDNACNQDLGICTNKERGQIKNPCLACVADSECDIGMKCLHHVLNDEDLGTFCFYAKSANDGCSDTRSAVRPFAITSNLASLDGPAVDYCLPPTSCLGYLDAISGTGGKSCDVDEDCGVEDSAIDNAVCLGTEPNARCTYVCTADNQCPGTDQSDCSGTGAGHCQP